MVVGRTICRNIEVFVVTYLLLLVSCLFHFLSRHKTSLSLQRSLTQQFLLSPQRFLPCFLYYISSIAIVVVSIATKFTSASCCVYRDLKILYHDKVFLFFIVDSECCFTTLLSFVATYNLHWSCQKLKCLLQHGKLCRRHFVLICLIVLLFLCRNIKILCHDKDLLLIKANYGFRVATYLPFVVIEFFCYL